MQMVLRERERELYSKEKRRREEMREKQEGITLVALVVTIIVLLILAGVTILLVIGNNGTIERSNIAKEETIKASYEEELQMIVGDLIIGRETETAKKTFIEELKEKIAEKWEAQVEMYDEAGNIVEDVTENTTIIANTNDGYEIDIEVENEKNEAHITRMTKEKDVQKYKVTYANNDGTGSTKVIEIRQGFSIKLEEIERESYNFIGWNEEGEEKILEAGSKYTPTKDIVLYAKWEEKEYITEGLTIWYDGINNAGTGTHSTSATKWKDLTGNGNDITLSGPTWSANALNFDGTNDYGTLAITTDFQPAMTVYTTFNVKQTKQAFAWVFVAGYDTNYRFGGGYREGKWYVRQNSNLGISGDDKIININETNSIAHVLNINNKILKTYVNGKLQSERELTGITSVNATSLQLGRWPQSSYNANCYAKMSMNNFMVYNRELTAEEIKQNYEVNKLRFNM